MHVRHLSPPQLYISIPEDRLYCCAATSTPNITFALGFHHSCWKEGGVNFTSTRLVKVPCRQCLTRFWFSKVNLQQLVRMQDPFCSDHSPRRRSLHYLRASPICLTRASSSMGCSARCLRVQWRKLDRDTFNGTLPCWSPNARAVVLGTEKSTSWQHFGLNILINALWAQYRL